MTADDAGSLHRLARGLGKTSEPGVDIAHAINSGEPKALAEFQVIREELARIGSKDQVRALDKAVINNVTEKQRGPFRELVQNYTSEKDKDGREGEKAPAPQHGGVRGRVEARKRRRIEAEKERQKTRDKDLAPRDALNSPLPKSARDAERSGFLLQSPKTSVWHQDDKGKPELKYIHPDGREVVFDGDTGQIITDPDIKGSYNYGPDPLSWDHFSKDILPFLGYKKPTPFRSANPTGPRKRSKPKK